MTTTNKKMALIDQLRARNQVDKQFTIQHGGEPFPVKLPNTLQWAALAATYPALDSLIQFKESKDDQSEVNDIDMAANVVGLAMALQNAQNEADDLVRIKIGMVDENGDPTSDPLPRDDVKRARALARSEDIQLFVSEAANMNENELEQAFLNIFFESHLTHKRLFLEAADRAAEIVASPGHDQTPKETVTMLASESTDTSST